MQDMTTIPTPPRSRVIAARIALFTLYYGTFVWILRHGGESWLHSLTMPIVCGAVGLVIGGGSALLWGTAMGLPLPWDLKNDEEKRDEV